MSTHSGSAGFRTALYLRLSRDDAGGGESSSITTQRSILREYAARQGFEVIDEYIDDGYSGTTFERPGFLRMLRDIELGRINCVLTKDLSRLGRNSARTSDLLDEYFPARGVRYISVTDGYDSHRLTGGAAMAAPLLAVMHEMYARDISGKIRSSFRSKMEKGEFIGSFAPYGYKKDTEHGNKNALVPDPPAAKIVREIFRMAAEGRSPGEIAGQLNRRSAATPLEYRRTGLICLDPARRQKNWSSSTVCKLLRNRVYLGITLQGKTEKLSFKSGASRPKPREEWIAVPGTHEAIVSEEQFRLAGSRVVSRRRPPAGGFVNVFSGLAICADCGGNMTPAPTGKNRASPRLCCGGYKSRGAGACSSHLTDYSLLYDAVLGELRTLLSLSEEEKAALAKKVSRALSSGDDSVSEALHHMAKRSEEVTGLMKRLYEDRAKGFVSPGVFEKLSGEYASESSSLERSMRALSGQAEADSRGGAPERDISAALDRLSSPGSLSKPLLGAFIDRIEIEQERQNADGDGKKHKVQKVHIYYRFSAPEQD